MRTGTDASRTRFVVLGRGDGDGDKGPQAPDGLGF